MVHLITHEPVMALVDTKRNLVSGSSLVFLLLNEPVLLNRGGLTAGGLTLNLNLLALVGLQLVGEVGLFGRLGSLGDGKFLDVGLGVTGLDGGGLVGLQLAEVELLDRVRCSTS